MGLSFGKLVVLVVIVVLVWSMFKHARRIEAVKATIRREMAARRRPAAAPRQPTIAAEDLVKCDRCGSYVAAGGTSPCGRADCAWGR
jgi:hypothetical protein